ncbi:1-acyl-sn-glycerol-3-phosphate acyltransferase [Spirochaetia bacterium]|nr:1-acyl-sn-glycerol-3-phosphate acyltransferase [Spirochaetia bacterium]
MAILKTIAAFGITILMMTVLVPIGILAFVLSFAGLKTLMSWVIYRIGQLWGLALIAVSGSKLTVTGREHIPRSGGVCFVSNHVGFFDILLALALIGRPFGFIAKKELIFVPFINIWIFILGGLYIDRKNIRKAVATINRGVKRLKAGNSMLIFPEGTRSRGGSLAPFKPGSLKLASQSGVCIVSIAIAGSYDVYEKTHLVHAAPVSVSFGKPITIADWPMENRKKLLADTVRTEIAQALGMEDL